MGILFLEGIAWTCNSDSILGVGWREWGFGKSCSPGMLGSFLRRWKPQGCLWCNDKLRGFILFLSHCSLDWSTFSTVAAPNWHATVPLVRDVFLRILSCVNFADVIKFERCCIDHSCHFSLVSSFAFFGSSAGRCFGGHLHPTVPLTKWCKVSCLGLDTDGTNDGSNKKELSLIPKGEELGWLIKGAWHRAPSNYRCKKSEFEEDCAAGEG